MHRIDLTIEDEPGYVSPEAQKLIDAIRKYRDSCRPQCQYIQYVTPFGTAMSHDPECRFCKERAEKASTGSEAKE